MITIGNNFVHHQSEYRLTSPKYRADIDGLRAIAVLSVVGFHAFPRLVKGGFVGVDIFFVVSGFLISTIIFSSLEQNSFNFLEFYSRRIRRIFPSLLVLLFAAYVFGWFALLSDEYKQLGKHIAAGAGFISNFVFLSESGYFDKAANTKPLLHLWSLGIEEQFYIIWPLLLWVTYKKRINLLTITIILAIISFSLNVNGIRKNAIATFYSPHTRLWELLMGSTIAWLNLNRKRALSEIKEKFEYWLCLTLSANPHESSNKTLQNVMSCTGLLMIAMAFLKITAETKYPGLWALLPTVGAGLIISAGSCAWLNQKVFSNRILVWLGLISYPFYLWHWTILSFMSIIESQTPSIQVRVTSVLVSITLAWLTYLFIERPVRYGIYKSAKTIVLLVSMIFLGFIGYSTYFLEGLEFRTAVKAYPNNKNELLRTPARDQECLNFIKDSNPSFYYCRFNNIGSQETVAVIGDSHAHVAYPGLADMLAQKGVNTILLANTGCPPFVGAEYGDNLHEKNACKQKIEDILSTVSKNKSIRKVLIFSQGTAYITGHYYGEAEVNDYKSPPIEAMLFRNGLQKTIDLLRSSGKSVFYVTENPELPVLPEACITRPFRSITKNCDETVAAVEKRQANYLSIIGTLKNVSVINTIPAFCPNGICKAFNTGGHLLYVDFHHLSVAGSKFQANEIIKPYLDRMQ